MFAISKQRMFVIWVCGLVACVLAFIFEVAGCVTVAWKVVQKQWLYGEYQFVEYNIVIQTGLWHGIYCVNRQCHRWEFGELEYEIPPHKSSSQGLVVAAIVFSFLAIVAIGLSKVTSVYTYINIVARIGAIVACVISFILALIPSVNRGNDTLVLQDSLDRELEDSPHHVIQTSILLPYSVLLCALGAALALLAALIMTSDLLCRGKDTESQFDSVSESGSMMNHSYTSYPSDDGKPGGGKANGQHKRKPQGSRDDLDKASPEAYEQIFSVSSRQMSNTHIYRTSTPEMYGSSRTVDSAKVLQMYAMENALRDSGLALSHRSSRSHIDLDSEQDEGIYEKRNAKRSQETNLGEESSSDSGNHPTHANHYAKRKDGHTGTHRGAAANKDRNEIDRSLSPMHDSVTSGLDKVSKISDRSLDADIDFDNIDYSDLQKFPPPPLSFRPINLPSGKGHVHAKIVKTQKHLVGQLADECPSGRQSEDIERVCTNESDFTEPSAELLSTDHAEMQNTTETRAIDEKPAETNFVQPTTEALNQVNDALATHARSVGNETSGADKGLADKHGMNELSDFEDIDAEHSNGVGVTNKAFEYNESMF